jgi:phospholipid/cholesterol/gamma-HCH transport system ATP-binding protein
MIRLENIHKSFGSQKVLDGYSLHVEKGDTFVILGRSGIGKSVTLKHIVGILKPDAGRVIIDGRDITEADDSVLFEIRRKVAYLFQSAALINWLSVGENVELPLREHTKLSLTEIRRRAAEALADLEMAGAYDKMPSDISGGMKKRAALARVLVMEPDIILYDEPTAGLDPIMTNNISHLIRDIQQRHGKTSIVVTHDLECAWRVGDQIGLHREGRLKVIGTARETRESDDPLVSAFLKGEGPDTVAIVPTRPHQEKPEKERED